MIHNRLTALPGRSMQDLVNSEPGWLYEGNAVLHPRGSEYSNAICCGWNPAHRQSSRQASPEPAEADDVDSLAIYTAGIPGRVLEERWAASFKSIRSKAQDPGFHGQLTLFAVPIHGRDHYSGSIHMEGQHAGRERFRQHDGHYLNPVVPKINLTPTTGTTAVFDESRAGSNAERSLLTLIVRHELARYEIPNELVSAERGRCPIRTTNRRRPLASPQTSLATAFSFLG